MVWGGWGVEWGSSPLARGLPHRGIPGPPSRRIIPARAGFTGRRQPRTCAPADHPRSRGVYGADGGSKFGGLGSSPLARGLRERCGRVGLAGRIIPARAGFTVTGGASQRRSPDHPRSRGVYPRQANGQQSIKGSSPLARGLRLTETTRPHYHGIIPARAGFTRLVVWTPTTRADHPRSRGVYPLMMTITS